MKRKNALLFGKKAFPVLLSFLLVGLGIALSPPILLAGKNLQEEGGLPASGKDAAANAEGGSSGPTVQFPRDTPRLFAFNFPAQAGSESDVEERPTIEDGKWKLSLQDCIQTTLTKNLDIIVQGYQTKIADASITGQEAVFDPKLSFNFNIAHQTTPQASQLGGGAVVTNDNQTYNLGFQQNIQTGGSYSVEFGNQRFKSNNSFATFNPYYPSDLSAQFTQPLLKGWGINNATRQIRIAKNSKKMTEEQFQLTVMQSISSAIDGYWSLVFQIDNLKVQRESLKLAKDFYGIEKARVDVGIKAPLDLAQAEASVAGREESVIVAESAVKDAEDRLKRLMNVPERSDLWDYAIFPGDQPRVDERELVLEECIQQAVESRPDLRSARLNLDSDRIRLSYAKNQLRPQLNFVGGYGTSGLGGTLLERDATGAIIGTVPGGYWDSLQQVFGFDYRSWSLGLQLAWDIRNRLAESQHLTERLYLQRDTDSLANLEAQVILNVRSAVRQVETNKKRVRAARIARELQEKKLDAEQKKYEHGLSTSFEVLQFQTDLTTAKSLEVRAITDLNRSAASLELAKGTLLEAYGVKYVPQ